MTWLGSGSRAGSHYQDREEENEQSTKRSADTKKYIKVLSEVKGVKSSKAEERFDKRESWRN